MSEAIGACLRARRVPLPDLIEKMLQRIAKRSVPAALSMEPLKPSLRLYDALLSGGVRS